MEGAGGLKDMRVGEKGFVSEAEEQNKALVRRFLEAVQKGDADTMHELLSPDFVDHSLLPGQEPGRDGYIEAVAEDHAAFSNVRYHIEDMVASGNKVITRHTTRAIHDRRAWMSITPDGREWDVMAILIHRISGGRIVEEWSANSVNLILEDLQQELRERERIEQELQVARRIQQASLPEKVPALEGWRISPYYRPAREVGGDFYDFHLLSEGKLGFVVGDATGKGVPAALVMSTTCGMLRAVALSLDSPGEVLEQTNEALFARIPANMFVTCFYAILDSESGHLRYANAGHDLPYLRRNGEAEELRARGMPLGLMPGMGYEEMEVVLEEGESVLFYSDGLVEAHDPEDEMFGFPRVRALLAEHSEEGPLDDFLLRELYSFVGEGWEQEDDITLLTLQRSATRS
jgi:serine phosphatase RsbU (regulator of sigma subunit)